MEKIFHQVVGCCMGEGSGCVCSENERVLRADADGRCTDPMTPAQREWCLEEADHDRYFDLAVMADALAAELESYTAADPWEMMRRLSIREHGYRAALHWCLVALEGQVTSGYEHRRAVNAAWKALKEER